MKFLTAKEIKGLSGFLYRDFVRLVPILKRYLPVVALYWGLGFFKVLPLVLGVGVVQILVMLTPLSLFVGEEKPPCVGVVLGRYTLALLLCLVCFLGNCFGILVVSGVVSLSPLSVFGLGLCVALSMGFLLLSVLFPLHFALGAERAKPWFFLLCFVVFSPLFLGLMGEGHDFPALSFLVFSGVLLCFFGFFLSFFVSLKVMSPKKTLKPY